MWQAWETEEMRRGFWWGDLEERNHLENLGIDGRIILKWIFKRGVRRAWTGLVWLRRETGFYKRRGNLLARWRPVRFSGSTLPLS
jgi:hypothetical protein